MKILEHLGVGDQIRVMSTCRESTRLSQSFLQQCDHGDDSIAHTHLHWFVDYLNDPIEKLKLANNLLKMSCKKIRRLTTLEKEINTAPTFPQVYDTLGLSPREHYSSLTQQIEKRELWIAFLVEIIFNVN